MPDEQVVEIITAKEMRQNKYYKTAQTNFVTYLKCEMCMHDIDGNLICKTYNMVTQNILYLPVNYKLIEVPEKEAKASARELRIQKGMLKIQTSNPKEGDNGEKSEEGKEVAGGQGDRQSDQAVGEVGEGAGKS